MNDPDSETSVGFFKATIWSTIIKAKVGQEEEAGRAALERLLTRYRQPILRHIQASLSAYRCSPEDAEDLTQKFIVQCLRLDFLKQISPEKGRFRTFIKACIKHFLRDQHARETAEKRGSGQEPLSLDETDGEGRLVLDPADLGDMPGTQMDSAWAASLLEGALRQLEAECVSARRADLFAALKSHLSRAPEAGTAKELGERLGMSEAAVHTARSRLRARLGEIIREEVRQTVGTAADWRDELNYLIHLLGQ